jgi:hypothetical protein
MCVDKQIEALYIYATAEKLTVQFSSAQPVFYYIGVFLEANTPIKKQSSLLDDSVIDC